MMHNHDTNETFMPADGAVALLVGGGRSGRELRPRSVRRDLLSRRCAAPFENVSFGEPDKTHWLMFVMAATRRRRFSPEAHERLITEGFMSADGKY